jgi:N-glycosylase/DNA lyase
LDLDENYAKIRGLVPKKDKFLSGAASIGTGIRILNQEPYEMLISYLISQRRSIPSIQTCIEKLCSIAGEEMVDTVLVRKPDGTMVEEEQVCYAFPTAKAMYEMSDEEYSSCGFGYREKYIRTAARLVAFGELDLEAMRKLSDEELYDSLISLYGVGPKVANCIMLFAYHRLDIFPRDVWINRVVDTYYGGDYDLTRYAPYNGVMQQYMFYAARNPDV